MSDVLSGIGNAVSSVTSGLGSAVSGLLGNGQAVSGALNLAGGVAGGQDATKTAQQAQGIANPFGQYMPGFAATLNQQGQSGTYGTSPLTSALSGVGSTYMNALSNPSAFYSSPMYKSTFDQGAGAVNAQAAAQGLNLSGNQLTALQDYGMSKGNSLYQSYVGDLSTAFNQALGANQQGFSQMAGLSGLASGSPSTAAGLLMSGNQNAGNAYSQAGSGLSNLISGAGSLFGSGTSSIPGLDISGAGLDASSLMGQTTLSASSDALASAGSGLLDGLASFGAFLL